MKNKYVFVTVLLVIMALAGFGFTRSYVGMEEKEEGEELLVVTSFYPMYVATMNVADQCEGVRIENLSEPQTGCLHDYQLTPQDMILLSEADVFIVNGGGIESFLTDVAEEYPNLTIINAGMEIFGEEAHEEEKHSEDAAEEEAHEEEDAHEEEEAHGGELHEKEYSHADHDHGENAHVWMSISHYMQQVAAIRDGLIAADNAHEDIYTENASQYLAQIEELQQEADELKAQAAGKNIIIFHEAFEFVAEDYDMQVAGELNLDEERQVSAGEVADILTAIKTKKIQILLAEDLYGKDMGDTIEGETDCKVYYLDTLVRGDGTKDSWLRGMKQNIELLKDAIK